MQVRRARPDDLEALAELFDLYRQFYGQTPDASLARGFMRERLERGDSVVFAAAHERDCLIGFTQLYPTLCSVAAARIYVLYDLFVHSTARRGGVGTALLDAARRFASEDGAVRLELATAITNTNAQRLYETLGWKRDDAFYHYGLGLTK